MNEYGGSTVDQRVVEMRIDNDKFEAGAKKTISILESLDNSLNNLGRQNADGFANVEKTMDVVTSKFSIMGTVGDQVLRNLTNSAMGMANELKRTVETLTTAQIGAGWNKYADKTSAVQTIMAATHKDIGSIYKDEADQMEKVNEQLEKMMWFSDETSYSFLDMTSNVGKFVAAGKGLEESVRAMMGISNWAAISGGRPAEASRAMYNLSQALGVGAVTTIDWKSIEMANMATYEFKQMAIETAEQMGILRRTSDKTWETVEGNYEVTIEKFRDTLSFGKGADKVQWFSSDVLLEVLSKYGEFTEALQEETEKFDMGATDMLKAIKAFDKIGTENEAEGLEELARIADRCDVSIEELLPSLQRLGDAQFDLGRRAFQSAQEAKTFAEAIEYTKDAASSQWMKLFEKIFGDYLQAKELWTSFAESLYTIFVKPVEDLNDALDKILGQNVFADILDIDGSVIGAEFLTPFKECEDALENISIAVDDVGNTIQETIDAISSAAFKDIGEDSAEEVDSLDSHLKKAGRTMDDFQDALRKVDETRFDSIISEYGTLDRALKEGAIDAEYFRRAMEEMANDTAKGIDGATQSFTELREVAMQVLRGDWGNGEERAKRLLEAGYDYDSVQWLAGNLGWMISQGWDVSQISDEYLMNLAKPEHVEEVINNLAETSASVRYTEEEIAEMNALLEDCDLLLEQIENGALDVHDAYQMVNGATDEQLLQYKTGGEVLRETMTNFMNFFSSIADAFNQAAAKVFGGEGGVVEHLGYFIVALYRFSKAIQFGGEKAADGSTKLDRLVSAISGFFRILKGIGSIIGAVWAIVRPILGLALDLIGRIVAVLGDLANGLGDALDRFSGDSAGRIQAFLTELGSHLGFVSGIFEIFATAVLAVIGALASAGTAVYEFISNSELLSSLISLISTAFRKVEGVINRVSRYIRDAYESAEKGNKAKAAITALLGSVERGFKRIIPYGEQIWAFFQGIWDFLKGSFSGVGALILTPFSAIESGFKKLWAAIKGEDIETDGVEEKLHPIRDAFSTLLTSIFAKPEEIKQNVIRFLGGIWDGIKEFVSTIRFRDVVSMLRLAVITTIAGDLLEFLHVFKHVKLEFDDMIETLSYMFEDIGFMFRGLAVNFKSTALIKMAVAIGIITWCIYKLTKLTNDVPDAEKKITYIASVIAILMGFMALLATSLTRNKFLAGNFINIKSFTLLPKMLGTLIGIAIIIAAAARAISSIHQIGNAKDIWIAFSPVLAILALFGTLFAVLTKMVSSIEDKSIEAFKIFAVGKTVQRIASAMGSMAFAVILLMAPVAIFARMASEDWDSMMWGLTAVGAMMTVLFLVMSSLANTVEGSATNGKQIYSIGKSVLQMSRGMIALAVAVTLLLIPIAVLSHMATGEDNGLGLQRGMLALGAILLGLFAFYWLLSASLVGMDDKQTKAIGNTLLKMAASMMLVATAVTMMLVPILILTAFAKEHSDELNQATGIVALIIVAFGAIMALSMLVASNAGNVDGIKAFGTMIIKLAAAMLIFSVAAGVLNIALLGLLYVMERASEVAKKIKNLNEVLLTLGAMAAILVVFGFAAKITGQGLLSLAIAFAVFAGGLWVLGHAFDIFADAWPKFKETLKSLGKNIKDHWKLVAVIGGIALAIGLLTAAISNLRKQRTFIGRIAGLLSNAFGNTANLGKNIGTGLGKIAMGIPKALGKMLAGLKTSLTENRAELMNAIVGMIIVITGYIVGIIPTMTNSIVVAVVELISSIASALNEHRPEIRAAMVDIVSTIFNILGDVFSSIGDIMSKIETPWGKALFGLALIKLSEGFFKLVFGLSSMAESTAQIANNATKINKESFFEKLFGFGKGGSSVTEKTVERALLKNTIKSAINESKVGTVGDGTETIGNMSPLSYANLLLKLGLIEAGTEIGISYAAGKLYGKHEVDQAYDGGSKTNIEDVLIALTTALNDNREWEESKEKFGLLYGYGSGRLTMDVTRDSELQTIFKDLQQFFPDIELEGFINQYENAIDPIVRYIDLINRYKDANEQLNNSYDPIIEKIGVTKELFNEYLTDQGGSVERVLTMLAIDRYITTDDIDAVADLLDTAVSLEEEVAALNENYDILAKRVGITREEFDKQYADANGVISNMPAVQAYYESFSDLITIAADGTIQLSEKGATIFAEQQRQAEEAAKATELEILKQEELQRMIAGTGYQSQLEADKYKEAHESLMKDAKEFREYLLENKDELNISPEIKIEDLDTVELLQLKEKIDKDINESGLFEGITVDVNNIFKGIKSGDISKKFLELFDLEGLTDSFFGDDASGEGLKGKFFDLAQNGLFGFGDGLTDSEGTNLINSNLEELFGTPGDYTSGLLGTWATDDLGEASPSKKFEQYGLWSDLGYANGILSQEGQSAIQNALATVFAGGMPIVGKRRWYSSLIANGQEQIETDKVRELEDSVNLKVNTKIENADDAFDGWTELIKGVSKSSIGAFETMGTDSAEGYANGILSKQGRKTVLNAFKQTFSATIKTLGQKNNAVHSVMTLLGKPVEISAECKTIGNNAGISLIKGIVARYKDARASGENIASSFINAFKKDTTDKKVNTEIEVDATPKVSIDPNELSDKIKQKFIESLPKIGQLGLSTISDLLFGVGSITLPKSAFPEVPVDSSEIKAQTKDESNKIIEDTKKQIAQSEKEIVDLYTEHEIDAEEAARKLHETWYNEMTTEMTARANTEQPIKKNENENIYIRSEDLAGWMDSQRRTYHGVRAEELGVGQGTNRKLWNGGDRDTYFELTKEWENMFDSAGSAKDRLKLLNDELNKIQGSSIILTNSGFKFDAKTLESMSEEEARNVLVKFMKSQDPFYETNSQYTAENHTLALSMYDVFRGANDYLDKLQKFANGDRGNARSRRMDFDLLDYVANPEMTPELYEKYSGWLDALSRSHPFYRSIGFGSFNNNGYDDVVLTDNALQKIEEAIQQTEKYRTEVQEARDWLKQNADALNLNIETDIDPISDTQILSWKSSMGEKALAHGIWDFLKLDPEELMKQLGLSDTTELTEKLTSAFSVFGVPIDGAVGDGIEENKGLIYNPMHDVFAGDLPLWFRDLLQINSPSKVFSKLAVGIPEGVAEGIKSQKGQTSIIAAIKELITRITANLENLPNVFNIIGARSAEALASGIRSRLSEVQAASREMSQAAQNVSRGVSVGIDSSSQVVESAGTSLANKLKNAFTKTLQIKSPSRVFMKLAEYVPQGVAEGVENEEDTAIDSVVVLSQDLIDAVQKSMAQVGVMAQDGFGEELSLKPVVDFSGMSSDIQRMNSVLTNAASMQALRNIGNPSAFNYNTENYNNRNQNKDILDEMHNMSIKLGKLGQELSSMQVVLNTGVLCGELASGVNSKLGGMATRQRR